MTHTRTNGTKARMCIGAGLPVMRGSHEWRMNGSCGLEPIRAGLTRMGNPHKHTFV